MTLKTFEYQWLHNYDVNLRKTYVNDIDKVDHGIPTVPSIAQIMLYLFQATSKTT